MPGGAPTYATELPSACAAVCPGGTEGDTAPNPVPHRITVSPRAAGRALGITLLLATSVPSWCVAIAYCPAIKNAGAKLSTVTVTVLLEPFALVTVTSTLPETSGACT